MFRQGDASVAAEGERLVILADMYAANLADVRAAARRIAPWLGRHGRWFNRATGAAFVGIGGILTTANRI